MFPSSGIKLKTRTSTFLSVVRPYNHYGRAKRDITSGQVYLVSHHIPDRTQRWRGVHFLQYNNKKCFIKFWAINKTEVQKIDVEVKVEVTGWLWLD